MADPYGDRVSDRRFVIARTADGTPYEFGRVIALHTEPTYVIETPDGKRFSWNARMTEDASPDIIARTLHEQLDVRR